MSQERMSAAQARASRSEHSIQAEIIEFLDRVLPASCYAFAVPNGGKRNSVTGAILKREGVKAGVADIVILRNPGMCGLIEVKKADGSLSNSQKNFRDWCAANGFPFAVVRSVGDVQAALADWGVPLRGRAA